MNIGYFTIPLKSETAMIDWDWLDRQEAANETQFVKHIRFEAPFKILIWRDAAYRAVLSM